MYWIILLAFFGLTPKAIWGSLFFLWAWDWTRIFQLTVTKKQYWSPLNHLNYSHFPNQQNPLEPTCLNYFLIDFQIILFHKLLIMATLFINLWRLCSNRMWNLEDMEWDSVLRKVFLDSIPKVVKLALIFTEFINSSRNFSSCNTDRTDFIKPPWSQFFLFFFHNSFFTKLYGQ